MTIGLICDRCGKSAPEPHGGTHLPPRWLRVLRDPLVSRRDVADYCSTDCAQMALAQYVEPAPRPAPIEVAVDEDTDVSIARELAARRKEG